MPAPIKKTPVSSLDPPKNGGVPGVSTAGGGRICSECKQRKPKSAFWKNNTACKTCRGEQYRRWRLANLEHCRIRMREYRKKNSEKTNAHSRKNYQKNHENWDKEKQKRTRRAWREKTRARRRKELQEKRRTDLNYRLGINLRNRIRKALHSGQKAGSAVRDLGCSIQFFKKYLEQQFSPGMTWENYGARHGWVIDHIKELCQFDLTDQKQFLKATHYTNQRPLWAKENLHRNKGINKRKRCKDNQKTTRATKSETKS